MQYAVLWRIHWVAKLSLRITVNLVKTPTKVDTTSPLFKGLEEDQVVWMSHVDYVGKVPEDFGKS